MNEQDKDILVSETNFLGYNYNIVHKNKKGDRFYLVCLSFLFYFLDKLKNYLKNKSVVLLDFIFFLVVRFELEIYIILVIFINITFGIIYLILLALSYDSRIPEFFNEHKTLFLICRNFNLIMFLGQIIKIILNELILCLRNRINKIKNRTPIVYSIDV